LPNPRFGPNRNATGGQKKVLGGGIVMQNLYANTPSENQNFASKVEEIKEIPSQKPPMKKFSHT